MGAERAQADVLVVPTGSANIASVLNAFSRLGARPRLAQSAGELLPAERVVLPGVGSFGEAMEELGYHGFIAPLRQRLVEGRPTLGICLGMQLMLEASDESRGTAGLGVAPGRVTRFRAIRDPSVRVPHIGWNTVTFGSDVFPSGRAYFANSYRLPAAPPGWTVATSEYDGRFVAAMARGAVLGCQFHPELSGQWGLDLIGRWLDAPESFAAGSAPPPPESPARLSRRIIPCLDVRDGRIVKGTRFQDLRDAGDPAEAAARYEAQGADELVVLDVAATTADRDHQLETVTRVRKQLTIPLTVGGGVRAADDASRLLDAGADKVAVNTAAVLRPLIIHELADRFGTQCVVAAIDAARAPVHELNRLIDPDFSEFAAESRESGYRVVIRAGSQRVDLDAAVWAGRAQTLGAGEILLTSWDRDGMRTGYELELLRAVRQSTSIPLIASGGAATPEHIIDAFASGADAVLAASIFHDGDWTVFSLKERLAAAGLEMRL